ncbi:uncharacterized protein CCOS01_12404 [Colletotrichum costaricense]|uniref:Ankyrin repeat protein n=1 Tax=Colletotrichum costaricense TaxID=1209916 RepID=A0AAI9YMS6_9PEZI|nr:uncharacterized protein CCOS01_12404 [Colletotrichum costaricense]KAK1516855.1 hypothetical protein CCOS01_12404 [Colletotrichum costaricense]
MQKALKGLPPKIRVLFTTDSSWLELNLGQKLDIEIKPQCEDIEAYVRHRIDNAPERKPHLKEAEEDVVETVTSIACKSKIFLLAELHMNLLSKQSTRAEISEALRQLPNHTEEVFEPSVQRLLILENKRDEKSRLTWRWAKHVLTWLVHGRPGLTADQIRDGFAISQSQGGDYKSYRPSIDDLVSSCDGLVAKKSDEQSRILCLVHDSVKDLLFERKVLLPKPTGDMASICLKFFCIPTSDAHEEQPPLLEYAARYWGHHLDLTPREDIGKVEADAMKFLQNSASLERSFFSLHPTKKKSFEGISGLHALVYFNLPYWAKRLISESGVDVNMESSNGQTPLHWAVRYGHLQLVQVLLRNSANPNKYDNKQQTPLHEALIKPVANEDANIARELVKYGARSELKNSRGYSAMTFAIKYGPTSIAKILIESQKDLDAEAFDGYSMLRQVYCHGREMLEKRNTEDSNTDGSKPLKRAVERHAQQLIDLLLDRGASLNQPSRDEWTPLKHAILHMYNDPSKIEKLLKRDPRPSDPNLGAGGETPLRLAITTNRPSIVKLLIDHGADQNLVVDDNGSTPLIYAIIKEHRDVVWVLLEAGASVDTKDNQGRTALVHAVMKNDESIAWLLISKGASIEYPVHDYPNLFCWCLAHGKLSLAMLVSQQANVTDAPDAKRERPLHWAAKSGLLEAVRFLLRYGVMIDAKDSEERTPLILATLMEEMRIVDALLKCGAAVDAHDKAGVTALHHAARLGFHDIVQLLLDWGCDRNLADFHGFNALHHAVNSDDADTEIVRLLAQGGLKREDKARQLQRGAANMGISRSKR